LLTNDIHTAPKLSPLAPPSSLAPVKCRMETFWYRFMQVVLEKRPIKSQSKYMIKHLCPALSTLRFHFP